MNTDMTVGKIEQLTDEPIASFSEPKFIDATKLVRHQHERIAELERIEARYIALRGMDDTELVGIYYDALNSIKSTGEQSVIDFNAAFDSLIDEIVKQQTEKKP